MKANDMEFISEAFHLYLTDEMIALIVDYTKRKIDATIVQVNAKRIGITG